MVLKRLAPFLIAFVLPLVLIYAWWGGFNPVSIEEAVRGPYTYAYLDHTGDYAKLPDEQIKARNGLERQKTPVGLSINVLYSNPDLVEQSKRVARTGYLVPAGTLVDAPLKVDVIPARPVLIARVQSSVILAPSRAYLALDKHLQAQGRGIAMPTVEIYESPASGFSMGVLSVEMNLQ